MSMLSVVYDHELTLYNEITNNIPYLTRIDELFWSNL